MKGHDLERSTTLVRLTGSKGSPMKHVICMNIVYTGMIVTQECLGNNIFRPVTTLVWLVKNIKWFRGT